MPGQSGGPVVTNSCVCFHYTRGCGCIDTRHSPRPRFFQGDRLTHTSGASRRENAEAYPVIAGSIATLTVIASEAKQSTARATVIMDCFVASLLAMTTLAV